MGYAIYQKEDNNSIVVPVATGTAIDVGDFVYLNGSGEAVSAADFPWSGLTNTQYGFAASDIGHCMQAKIASTAQIYGNSTANQIVISTSGVFEADCASTTWALGDFVGLAQDGANLALAPQKVAKVANASRAIGVCTKAGSSLTRCQFRLLSAVVPLGLIPTTTTSTTTTTTTSTTTTSTTTT